MPTTRPPTPGARPPPAFGVPDPASRALLRGLRAAVGLHAATEPRRHYPPALHAGEPGEPGGPVVSLPLEGGLEHHRLDHALRVDVVEALLGRVLRAGRERERCRDPGPLVWLTRPGPLDPHELDLAWHRAARTASAELGVALAMVVVGRRAWRDPGSDAGRAWVRLR
ncbi:hypothetical protein GCM10023340_45410 [Nocardioides marinquilinus]|uniref:Uncharacterized protein n=1 Tax=Nocardioides marinquilinus TaxID=1210400 RepID=A0ABP9Q551_9ACTN